MRKSLHRIVILAKRNLLEVLREPLSLVFLMGMPLMMEVLFYFIFHNMTDQFEMKYLAPRIVAFSQAFLALFTGLLIATDRSSAFLTRLFVSKAKSHEFIFGYTLALLPVVVVQSVLFFLVGGAIAPSLFGLGMLWSVLLSVITSLFFVAMGILFGTICNEKAVGGVASIIITGQSILSGMWFPTEGMGQGILIAMRVLPFKNAADVLQNVLFGATSFQDFGLPLLILLAYTVVAFVAAIWAFRRKMKAQ